jgi:Fe-S cluster assembly ATP-binding protein
MEPEERALEGLFMSFQSPVAIPVVSNDQFLQVIYPFIYFHCLIINS